MPLTISAIAGLAGALAFAGTPAALSTPPVSVVSCDYNVFQSSAAALQEISPLQTASLRITFVNQAPLAATNVRFAVRYADRTQIIDDAGTFSTGTPITQDFTPTAVAPYASPGAECSVQSVTFADGSTWQPA